ncbi:phosphoribosylanthranilate isomerase [Erythrobacter aquimaris]|uniref:N-(5'-phosphoribosyl)anthranilate isomerase n=1 Tax=Qipengyuania aquimaris TaxID=255984 RepID=A0A6I4TLK0_9SPHN|nr:phosphoribosylanthranilate isomerase [Qipengyuania aquimaris]MXO95458.1 phosphoribosylanthranilate isomerase [Qipengyuania aquimaris]
MTDVAIKICGISTPDALDAATAARADFVGLVFFPPSPRHVDGYAAAALAARAGSTIGRVGLFVDADDGLIGESVRAGRLDAIQLHGEETPERVAQVKERFGLPVWKAIPVATARDVEKAKAHDGVADLLLFDARTPKDAALPGGMGLSFDWSLLSAWRGKPGWGLAGGLSAANVAGALAKTGAPLLDTSSGVETAPGHKDPEMIRAFCKAARNA